MHIEASKFSHVRSTMAIIINREETIQFTVCGSAASRSKTNGVGVLHRESPTLHGYEGVTTFFSFAPESVDFLVDGIDRVSASGSGGIYIVEVDSCRTETGGLPPYDSTMAGLYYDT